MQRMPVDHLLFATVEAGDSAIKAPTQATTPNESQHGPLGLVSIQPKAFTGLNLPCIMS